MSELKMCVYCEHCEHEEGRMYSTWTGWQSGYYSCQCNHFSYKEEAYEGWALRAMTCPDYELSHKVQEEIKKIKDNQK